MVIGEALIKFSSNATAVVSDLKKVASATKEIATSATSTASKVANSFTSFGKSIGITSDNAKKAVTDISSFSSKLLLGGAAAVGFGVSSAASFEQTRIAMETMLGSAQAAQKMMKDLGDFAKTTPFTFPQITESAKQLLAFGVSADSIIPTMTNLGNIAAGVGQEKLPQVILAFGQMTAKTKLSGEELRQFNEAGIPLLQELAKVTGKSTAEIQQAMDSGVTIPAKVAQQALFNLSGEGGRFNNLMAKQSKSLAGIWSNLQDSVGFTMRKLIGISDEGEVRVGSAFDVMRNAAQLLVGWLTKIQDASPAQIQAAVSFAGALLTVAASFTALIGVIKLFIIFSNPLMVLFLAIAALFGATVFNALEKFQKKMAATSQTVSQGTGDMAKAAATDLPKVQKLSDETTQKLADIGKQIEKTKKDFIQNLADIVFSHQEKVDSIKSQLDDENSAFQDSDKQNLKSFTDTMAKMVKDHQKKVDAINSSISDETQSELDKEAKIQQSSDSKLQAEQVSYAKKTDAIKKSIDDETAKGLKANQTTLTDLKASLAQQEQDHSDTVDAIKADIADQLKASQDSSAARLADLKSNLDQENQDFQDATAERQQSYEEDTAKAKEEHDKKLAELQASLAVEQEFVTKHEADVAQVKDVARLDEIDKLKQQYAEQMAQYEEDKKNALKADSDKNKQLVAASGSTATDIAAKLSDIPNQVDQAGFKDLGKDIGTDMAKALKDAFKESIKDTGSFLKDTFSFDNLKNALTLVAGDSNNPKSKQVWDNITSLFKGNAKGTNNFEGGWTWINEQGPELVKLPSGTQIFPHDKSVQMLKESTATDNSKSISINQNITYTRDTDPLANARQLAFELQRR